MWPPRGRSVGQDDDKPVVRNNPPPKIKRNSVKKIRKKYDLPQGGHWSDGQDDDGPAVLTQCELPIGAQLG